MARKYDVFISYRRLGGEQTAKIICDRLTDLGYKVFYDVEALRSGAFNTKLYSVIDECQDVIVVLSHNSLDRCTDENDWVRLEIAHALSMGKNVVPVFLRGFIFPERLPENISKLRYQNGLEANSEFFDAFITRLQLFLKSKPTFFQRIGQNIVFRRMIPFVLSLIVVLGVFAGIWVGIKNSSHSFPRTQEQKNITSEALGYVQQNLMIADIMIGEMAEAYAACSDYLIDGNEVQYQNAVARINRAYGTMGDQDIGVLVLSDNLSSRIDTTPINKGDLVAVNGYNSILNGSFKNDLLFIKQIINPQTPFDLATKRKILEIYRKTLDTEKKNISYGINDLLLPVDKSFLDDFMQKYLPMLTNLSFGDQTWLEDKQEIERIMESGYNQQLKLQNDLASIVGNENYQSMQQVAELEQQALAAGMSQSQVDTFIADTVNQGNKTAELKKQLKKSTSELENLKKEAKEKFSPQDSDDPGLLWGKMLRFINLQMYDEAVKCVQMYQIKVHEDFPEADVFVPAVIRFIKQIPSTGIDYGVVVCGYEPDKEPHSVYQIGDIIIGINDSICTNYQSFVKFMPSERKYTAVLLRPNADDNLKITNVSVPAGEPKVLLLDLTEKE